MEYTLKPVETAAEIQGAMALYHSCVSAGEVLYRPFETVGSFEDFFLNPQEGVRKVCLSDGSDGCFASGCLSGGKAYITFLAVRPDLRRQGRGKAALSALEEALKQLAPGALACMEITFFNPMNFVWTIPGTDHHLHPNAPGVDVSGSGYLFFKNCGYRDYAAQNSYYLNLQGYRLTDRMALKKAELSHRGVEITTYDRNRHTGLLELLENLGNPLWKQEISRTAEDPEGAPILIAAKDGRVIGFTGPVKVQEQGRGYLAGLGIHSDFRGLGAGKVLFGELCVRLRAMGAEYMTLFTGENNPARNIYEAQGFRIVRTWADMRKPM